jgi:hypothetical protein
MPRGGVRCCREHESRLWSIAAALPESSGGVGLSCSGWCEANTGRAHCQRHTDLENNNGRGSKGVNAVRQAMDTAPCPIWVGDEADEILGRPAFPFNKRPFELDLVILSVFELGFGDRASRNDPELGASVEASLSDIYARAASLGFELCPVEAGPALRLNYLDQPLGEFLHIAMKPVARYSGELVDFTVGNGGAGLMLVGGNGHPEVKLPGATRFVFVRPHADTVAGGSVRDGGGNLVER